MWLHQALKYWLHAPHAINSDVYPEKRPEVRGNSWTLSYGVLVLVSAVQIWNCCHCARDYSNDWNCGLWRAGEHHLHVSVSVCVKQGWLHTKDFTVCGALEIVSLIGCSFIHLGIMGLDVVATLAAASNNIVFRCSRPVEGWITYMVFVKLLHRLKSGLSS